MSSLLIVTHPEASGKYDSGLLEEKLNAAQNFPGEVHAVTEDRNTELYAESIYDQVIEDTADGLVAEEDAEELLQFDHIYRAGAQYSNCCANTDISIAAQTDDEIEFTYFTDLTVDETGNSTEILDNSEKISQYNYAFERGVLTRNFTTFNDLTQRTF